MAPSPSRSRETPHISDRASHCRRRRRERTGEKCPAALALASLEIAITGAHRAFARLKLVAIHCDAHRAARLPPFGARFHENAIESFRFGLALDLARARYDEHPDAGRDMPTAHNRRCLAQIGDARVGAAADEHDFDRPAEQWLARLEPHVAERMAEPVYSRTLPVAPPIPIFAMMARMMSFAVTPRGSIPSMRSSMLRGLRWSNVWVPRT